MILGTSIFVDDYSFVIELSLANQSDVELDGSITTATVVDGQPTSVTNTEAENFSGDTFQSISVGFGFEFYKLKEGVRIEIESPTGK